MIFLYPKYYVNGPDIEILIDHHPQVSFDIDPQHGTWSLH